MRREKSLGGIHEQVSVMLNIKLTLSGRGGLEHGSCRMTEVHVYSYIHSQESLLLELLLLLVLLATGLLNDLPGLLREGLVLNHLTLSVILTSL